jgi:hypothetical protein
MLLYYDGPSCAVSMHPHGHHIYHGPAIMNWHARPQQLPPPPSSYRTRTYLYHGPVTINYVGRGTFDAAIPGRHVHKQRVTVNWTGVSKAGAGAAARDGDPLVRLEYYDNVRYHRLVEGMPVPTAVALLGDAHVTAGVVEVPAWAGLPMRAGVGYRCVRDW